MPKRSSRRSNSNQDAPQQRSVASHVRERHRAVAEREASRLARPEAKKITKIMHADRKKSAVSSTPSGFHRSKTTTDADDEYCGPFKIARQFVEEQEAAKRQEEQEANMNHPLDEAMEELDESNKRKAHPSMQWKSSNKRLIKKPRTNTLKTLFETCTQFLVDNFDEISSLGYLDSQIRTKIANALIQEDKLNGETLKVVAESGVDLLDLKDCSSISEADLEHTVKKLIAGGLQYMHLDQAGRCVTHKFVHSIKHAKLLAISIGGAYLLKDADAAKIVHMAPPSLAFKACNLLGPLTCRAIADTYAATNHRLLELALEDLKFAEGDLQVMVSNADTWKHIRSLTCKRIHGLTDGTIETLLDHASDTVESLDISENHELSDDVLAQIRNHDMRNLQRLNLSGLKNLTESGLMAFFMTIPDATPPPKLISLDMANLDHTAVSDSVVDLLTQSSQLQRLNIQASTVVSDVSMEYLAKRSTYSLESLKVSYCTQVSDKGLGYLVDQCPGLRRLDIWGNAQLSDEFFCGHSRTNDPSLEVVGTWMKSGNSS